MPGRAQELIAGIVTEGVVDVLEVVEVELQDRDQRAVAARLAEGHLEAQPEQGPVGEAGQRIVVRQLDQPLLGFDQPAAVVPDPPYDRAKDAKRFQAQDQQRGGQQPGLEPPDPLDVRLRLLVQQIDQPLDGDQEAIGRRHDVAEAWIGRPELVIRAATQPERLVEIGAKPAVEIDRPGKIDGADPR